MSTMACISCWPTKAGITKFTPLHKRISISVVSAGLALADSERKSLLILGPSKECGAKDWPSDSALSSFPEDWRGESWLDNPGRNDQSLGT